MLYLRNVVSTRFNGERRSRSEESVCWAVKAKRIRLTFQV